MQSRLPKAKEFKKGVKEILKRIRLTGKYEADTHSDDDHSRELIEALKENNALLRQALQAALIQGSMRQIVNTAMMHRKTALSSILQR